MAEAANPKEIVTREIVLKYKDVQKCLQAMAHIKCAPLNYDADKGLPELVLRKIEIPRELLPDVVELKGA